MLLPAQLARVDAALAVARQRTEEAAQLADGGAIGEWWASLIGADSSTAALRSNAAAARALLDSLEAKAARWKDPTSPIVEDVEVADFERAATNATSNAASQAAADQLSPVTAPDAPRPQRLPRRRLRFRLRVRVQDLRDPGPHAHGVAPALPGLPPGEDRRGQPEVEGARP